VLALKNTYVPTAAVIGVIVRHLLGRYRESDIYRGGNPA